MNPLTFARGATVAAAAVVAMLAGCSKEEKTTTTATPAASAASAAVEVASAPAPAPVPAASAPLKIAFAYVGPVGDGGWTFAHDNARKALEKQFGDKIATSSSRRFPRRRRRARVSRHGGQGNKLIFGTTFGYMEPMLKTATDLPDVSSSTPPATRPRPTAHLRQPHLRGRSHGRRDRRRHDQDQHPRRRRLDPDSEVIRNINSFTLGAQSVNLKIKTKVVWVNEWFNPPKETEAAQSLINAARRVDAEHRLVGGAADGGQGRQVRLRLGQRHDRVRAQRAPRPGDHQLGAVLHQCHAGRARRHVEGSARVVGCRKARSTSSRSPRRCGGDQGRSTPSRPA
jgi:simple sugar transport system substrate-binding protein